MTKNEGGTVDILKPTLHFDGGAQGRIVVADSLSFFEHDPWLNDVAMGASFAGVPTAAMALRGGVKAWIAHEGGPGKDEAGIGGLALSDRFGVPAAAIRTMEARLSNGRTLLTGHVARANDAAEALGVRPGMSGEETAHLMLKAKPNVRRPMDGLTDEDIHEMASTPKGKIYAVWSSSRVEGRHPNDVYCLASHGARVMTLYVLRIAPKGIICNDAGMGMDNSGCEGLWELDEHGVAAATVSTDSARIGDVMSTYEDGVISACNKTAEKVGVRTGMKASDAAHKILG